MTEQRSRSLTRSLSDKFVEPLTRPLNLSFLADIDRRKSATRDRSKENTRKESSRWIKNIKDKEIGQYTISDKSFYRRRQENNKIPSRQNTYILQVPRIQRSLPEEPEDNNSYNYTDDDSDDDNGLYHRLSKSVDDIDYCRVLDDISPIPEKSEDDDDDNYKENREIEEEDHYAEICEVIQEPGYGGKNNKDFNNIKNENDLDRISHVSLSAEENDSRSDKTAKIDFEDDHSLDRISLEMFEKESSIKSIKVEHEKTTRIHEEIKEIEKTSSNINVESRNLNNNLITVEAVIHENKENENKEKSMKESLLVDQIIEDVTDEGEEISLISVGNYDIPKSIIKAESESDSYDVPKFSTNSCELNNETITNDNEICCKNAFNNKNTSDVVSLNVTDEVVNRINTKKTLLGNHENKQEIEIKDNNDFNGNEIKIVLKGNTVVIRVKDDEIKSDYHDQSNSVEDKLNRNNISDSSSYIESSVNKNITRTILCDDQNEVKFSSLPYAINNELKDIDSKFIHHINKASIGSNDDIPNAKDNESQMETDSSDHVFSDDQSSDSDAKHHDINDSPDYENIDSPDLEGNDSDTSSLISVSDSGIYFIKLRGFELPESEIGKALNGNSVDCYDSLC